VLLEDVDSGLELRRVGDWQIALRVGARDAGRLQIARHRLAADEGYKFVNSANSTVAAVALGLTAEVAARPTPDEVVGFVRARVGTR